MPLLEDALKQFSFIIKGFHSDNGSEYINKIVAQLLHKLLIHQTKSRPRHCNDNAKEGVTYEKLNTIAHEKSDNECAAHMQKAKQELFKNLSRHKLQFPTNYQYHLGLIA